MLPDRTCSLCGQTKPVTAFHPRRDAAAGVKSACKTCSNARTAEYRRVNGGRYGAVAVARYRAAPEIHRFVARGQHAVHAAIKRGDLTRPDVCEQCGSVGRIEAAHHDYTRPLDVRWLCHSCHVLWDRAQPKMPHR